MLAKILLALAALAVVLAVVVSLRPSTFRVVRSTRIAAPPQVVFPLVNDFHRMVVWSPWSPMDPAMTSTFDGPPAGVGSSFAWSGNSKVGQGRLTIAESRPGEYVRYHQEFFKPMKGVNTAEFTLRPDGAGTVVTWEMHGDLNFISKAFGLFVSMDKMMGGTFEQGLARMKTLAEADAAKS